MMNKKGETKSVSFKEDSEMCEVFFYTFPCDECDFETASKNTLEYHIQTEHDNQVGSTVNKFTELLEIFQEEESERRAEKEKDNEANS